MTKLRFASTGLLHPFKLRAWDLREQIKADAASGKASLTMLPRS